MGVECRITSAYHPQSNGLDERFNQTLQKQLLKFVGERQDTWDEYLDDVLFAYRVSVQDSTKYSPFFLVYGRNARLPIEYSKDLSADNKGSTEGDGVSCDPEESEGCVCEIEDAKQLDGNSNINMELGSVDCERRIDDKERKMEHYSFEDRVDKMIAIRKKALSNIEAAQERQKRNYDKKHGKDEKDYKVGSLVLMKNSKKLSRKGSKMEQNWLGPYRIHESAGKGTYRLSNPVDKSVLRNLVNITRLKLYYKNEDETMVGLLMHAIVLF